MEARRGGNAEKGLTVDEMRRNRRREDRQNDQPEKAQVRSGWNSTEEGGDGRMTRWGHVEDLPQAKGCETLKAERPKQGHKEPQKQTEKTTVQGGGRGKGKEKGGAPGLGHQVNN